MIIVLKENALKKDIDELKTFLEKQNVKVSSIEGTETTVLGLVGDTSHVDVDTILLSDIVDKVMKVSEPYKRANRSFHPENTVIELGNGVKIGENRIVMMAGPCAVENEEQLMTIAKGVKKSGASLLRGGAFKPRSSPYAFQGLKSEGLVLLKQAKEMTGLPIVSEITNQHYVELFNDYVDVIQVGARNMQNFELLKELGKTDKPILLKRGFANTMEELLMSAEYIMSSGNEKVILCERGIRTSETYTRNTLDISAVPVLKRKSHLPVIVDPSHAAGTYWLVEPLALAAVAAGCDGLIVEVHNDPKVALSDGAQSLTLEHFEKLMDHARGVALSVNRSF